MALITPNRKFWSLLKNDIKKNNNLQGRNINKKQKHRYLYT